MPEKILLVDDEADVSRMMSDFLRLNGYEVITAENATAATERAAEIPFNLVILDVNLADLAGRDGSNLMAAMKRNHPQTPILLYTGMSAEDEEVKHMLELGATGLVFKGDTVEVLVKAVQKATKRPQQKS